MIELIQAASLIGIGSVGLIAGLHSMATMSLQQSLKIVMIFG
jgi:hypothetical protein